MKMLFWFGLIIGSLLVAWVIPRIFKSYRVSQFLTVLVGAGWLLWTGGLSTLVVGYSLGGKLLGIQMSLIVAVTSLILFLSWLYKHQKDKEILLKKANERLLQSLSDLSIRLDEASTSEKVMSGRVIKGANDHRKELFSQLSETNSSLVILSGWVSGYGVDYKTKRMITRLLKSNIEVTLGWGYTKNNEKPAAFTHTETWLKNLQRQYPSHLHLLYFRNHSKIIVRDDEEAVVGSFNWLSNNGRSRNDELSLVITDKETIKNLNNTITTKSFR